MPCDPNELIEQAKCLSACIPTGMMPAVNTSLLCQILDASGGSGGGEFVLKTGDAMTGGLSIDLGTESVGPGEALRLSAVFDDGGAASQNFFLLTLKADTSSGNFNDVTPFRILSGSDAILAYISYVGGMFLNGSLTCLEISTNAFTTSAGSPFGIGFFGTAPVVKQTSGANLTNNVTVGGVNDTIADFTSLTVYATDAAAIRNDIYQLARKLKQINDGLRAYGLFT